MKTFWDRRFAKSCAIGIQAHTLTVKLKWICRSKRKNCCLLCNNDIRLLEAIKTILDEKAEDSSLELTDDQKKEIAESKKQTQEGLFYKESDIDSEIQGWLDAK